MVFYGVKVWSDQILAGGQYLSLQEVNMIVVTGFDLFPEDDKDEYLTHYQIMILPPTGGGKYEKPISMIWMTCVNLAKFNVPIDELSTPTERWIFFLKHPAGKNLYDVNMVIDDDDGIRNVYGHANEFYWSPKDRNSYKQEHGLSKRMIVVLEV